MDRFDALTTLDTKPLKTTVPSEKPEPQNTPLSSLLSENQPDVHANQQTRKDASMQTSKPVSM